MSTPKSSPLDEYLTLREIARRLGASYFTAYSLAARGLLGDPLFVGRVQLYPRATAERAIRERLAARARRNSTGTPTQVA